MRHEMRLDKIPFEKVRNGSKIIESRLFDEKRQTISPGDEIMFRQADDPSQEVKTRVSGLFRYGSFQELMTDFPPDMFGGKSTEEIITEILQFYPKDDEKKYGVVGIKITRI